MNEKTKNILNMDTVATAEALIGKRHEEWDTKTDGVLALGLTMLMNKSKREHLESMGDTHSGITWQDFIGIVKAYGFKCGFRKKFMGTGWSDIKDVEEEEVIFFLEEKGLILYAESFGRDSINSAVVYGEVKTNDELEENQWNALTGCSYGGNRNGTMSFDVDCREGLRFHLDAISEVFEFSKSWTRIPFLWFLNYMDTKDENYNYEKITKQKIDECSPEVRKIIFG